MCRRAHGISGAMSSRAYRLFLTNANTHCRVSSVLNRDVKQFGKKHLFDGEEDTCWNSDQGLPQWVHVELTQLSNVEEIKIRFQGGFAGKECWVESHDCEGTPTKIMDFYPEDINSLQSYKLPKVTPMKNFRIVFNTSTDFYGRVTIYELLVIGSAS